LHHELAQLSSNSFPTRGIRLKCSLSHRRALPSYFKEVNSKLRDKILSLFLNFKFLLMSYFAGNRL